MAVVPIIQPSVPATLVAPITPTANDTIPCAQFNVVFLVMISSTGTPTVTATDPTSSAPAGLTFTDLTADLGALTAGQLKVARLDCGRFRNTSGDIAIQTTSPTNSTVFAIGI